MILFNFITDYPAQRFQVVGENKEQINIALRYMPSVQSWRMDISYNDFKAYGLVLVNSPNILRQWKNILPFGLNIGSIDGVDPMYLDDFSKGRVSMTLLNSSERDVMEQIFE